MPKVKSIMPVDPEQEPKDDQDEQDDEPEDQDEQDLAQSLGMLRATEDLTVLDFFAGMISTVMVNTMASKDITDVDRDVVADRIYKMAKALARSRAKIEAEELY